MIVAFTWLICFAGPGPGPMDGAELPRHLTLEDQQESNPSETPPPRPDLRDFQEQRGGSSRFIDLRRLEAEFFVGFTATGGTDAFGGFLVRAPLPCLSPHWPTDEDDLGLFLQIQAGGLGGNSQGQGNSSGGGSVDLALGLDYTLLRSARWRLSAQVGVQFGSLGNSDFSQSIGPLLGITGGVRISEHVWILLNPQVVHSSGGGWTETNHLGVLVSF